MIRGCGRTDFQDGDSSTLWESVHTRIFTLPRYCAVYPAHDYRGNAMSSVGEEIELNPRLGKQRTKEEFVALMSKLDLSYPKKIDIALPANRVCGIYDDEGDLIG